MWGASQSCSYWDWLFHWLEEAGLYFLSAPIIGTKPDPFSLTDIPLQIVFDECHKAKNASSTKMGKAVLDLQNKLPRARVVYASATGEVLWVGTMGPRSL